MALALVFLTSLLGYALLYAPYSYAVKALVGRVVWVAALRRWYVARIDNRRATF